MAEKRALGRNLAAVAYPSRRSIRDRHTNMGTRWHAARLPPVDLRFLEALNRSPVGVAGGEWLAWMGVDRDRATEPDRIFGVRRAPARRAERRHAGVDDEHRSPQRAVRRDGRTAAGHQRTDRPGRRAGRTLRAGMVGGDDHRTHRRPRPGGDDLHAAARARRVADPRRRPGQPRRCRPSTSGCSPRSKTTSWAASATVAASGMPRSRDSRP